MKRKTVITASATLIVKTVKPSSCVSPIIKSMEKSVVECGKIGFNSTRIRQMNDLQELLLNKYVEILNKPEHQNLLRAISNKDNKLSNIHLGFVPEHYESAEHKILIVG